MEDKKIDKCVMLTRKEYDDLKSRAESNSPEMKVKMFGSWHCVDGEHPRILSTVDFSKPLLGQLNRILDKCQERMIASTLKRIVEWDSIYKLTKRETRLLLKIYDKVRYENRAF